jgi:hypothetical protein
MGEELKKFKAEFGKLDNRADAMWKEVVSANLSKRGLSDFAMGRIDRIGARVKALKDAGRSGDSVADFLDDKEVKSLSSELDDCIKKARANYESEGVAQQSAQKIFKELKDLKTRIEKEAKARKNKLVGKESESAPEMEKLAKEIGEYWGQSLPKVGHSLEGFAAEKPSAFRMDKYVEQLLREAINRSKTDRDEELAEEMLKQKLNIRLVTRQQGAVYRISGEVTKNLSTALTALKEKRGDDSTAALAAAVKGVEEIADILKPLDAAFTKFIKGREAADSDDGKEILRMLTLMTTLHNKALKEVAAVQSSLKKL